MSELVPYELTRPERYMRGSAIKDDGGAIETIRKRASVQFHKIISRRNVNENPERVHELLKYLVEFVKLFKRVVLVAVELERPFCAVVLDRSSLVTSAGMWKMMSGRMAISWMLRAFWYSISKSSLMPNVRRFRSIRAFVRW